MRHRKMRKMWIADRGDGTYRNPVLYADYSDPDAIRVGKDYYMVASSFCNTPVIPILHSLDLVNWKVINYVADRIPFDGYEVPRHGCGAWAPAIRYHEGVYYVFIPFPDEGIMVSHAVDPYGTWSELTFIKKAAGWIDPCPFWDDDGKAYMVSAFAKSRIGFKSYLYITPISPDCTEELGEGHFVYDGHDTQPTIEGPKLYKRNGYYYIFAPAGGVKEGWQTVLRSRNIYGPYEEKIVLHQGSSSINGPHQGAWVDTEDGKDYFLHFQDAGCAGRIIHLQPMKWVDDWPVIGERTGRDGCGEPVQKAVKPVCLPDCVPDAPEDSDLFQKEELGLQWQWNANFHKEWYSLKDGGLTLYAQCIQRGIRLCDVGNLLLQKWPAPQFQVTVRMHMEAMAEGDVCGMVSQGGRYTSLLVVKKMESLSLCQRTGDWDKQNEIERYYYDAKLGTENTIYLRMYVRNAQTVSFAYGFREGEFLPIGEAVDVRPGRWVGVKAGLTAFNEQWTRGGSIKADYFIFQPLK